MADRFTTKVKRETQRKARGKSQQGKRVRNSIPPQGYDVVLIFASF
jgi:hypothetical protein